MQQPMSNYNLNNKYGLKFKGLNVIIIVLVSLFFLRNSMFAQDIHFSQLLSTPVLTNPANTGITNDQLRFATDYRNQWTSIGYPYNTFYTSLDKQITVRNQLFGIGIAFIHDRASVNSLSAEKTLLSLSYARFYKNHEFIIGIQPALVYKYFSNNGLTFGSQFDPAVERYNQNLPNYENHLNDYMNYFDLNIGILWRANIKSFLPVAGFSMSHIGRPLESFMDDSSGFRLPLKYTFHGQVTIPVNNKYDITPCYLFSYTPGAREFIAGGIGGYSPGNFFIPVKKIYVINLYRINPARNIDAIIIGGGFKFAQIDCGISYDFNVSSLSKVTNFRGAFEVSLIYTGGTGKKNAAVEPCLIY
jgi:type IX secretion system PorP/SprF family membrane protein